MQRIILRFLSLWIVLLCSCGGGGGGGGGGSSDTIDAQAYFLRDTTRAYTFAETIKAEAGGQSATEDRTKVFSYETMDEIPATYGDFGAYPGPYRKETVSVDGDVSLITYTDTSGNVLVSDDLTSFTRILDSDTTGDDIGTVVLGRTYRTTSTQTLFDSATGQEVGTSVTTSTFRPDAIENLSVAGRTLSTLKATISYTVNITQDGETQTTQYSGTQWFSQGFGLVQGTLTYQEATGGVTVTYTITDVLASIE